MKKSVKIIIWVVIVIAVLAVIAMAVIASQKNSNGKTNLPEVKSSEDLSALIEKIYEQVSQEKPMLETKEVDLTDAASVKSYTGLEDGSSFEHLSVSEPMISSIAYSLVVGKVTEGVNANEIAKQMSESIDPRKWICVSAEKIYATNSGDYVFLVMGNEELAKSVYESFKSIAGTVGEEYEKTQSEEQLPPDTEAPGAFQVPLNVQ